MTTGLHTGTKKEKFAILFLKAQTAEKSVLANLFCCSAFTKIMRWP